MSVQVASISAQSSIINQRDDILNSKNLSYHTIATLHTVGIESPTCKAEYSLCVEALSKDIAIEDDELYAALSEIWLLQAQKIAKDNSDMQKLQYAPALLNSLRYAYAYLFLTANNIDSRSLNYRQVQVRDYYNYCIQEITKILFNQHRKLLKDSDTAQLVLNDWVIDVDLTHVSLPKNIPVDLLTASTIVFKGINNLYRRDGIGCEMVVAPKKYTPTLDWHNKIYQKTPFISISVIAELPLLAKKKLHQLKHLKLTVYNPIDTKQITINHTKVPLAANFTASYGLWLASMNFNLNSLVNLLRFNKQSLKQPIVYLMQPYDPNKKIVVLLHGLAGSPSSWVNLANDIVGDDELREHYQIWQVYYPTNYPIAINHKYIRQAINATLDDLTKDYNNPVKTDIVIIGHSMGGVIARLMISSSGEQDILNFLEDSNIPPSKQTIAKQQIKQLFNFSPMKQISRAIFIATPHYGTPSTKNNLSLWLANRVNIPEEISKKIKNLQNFIYGNGTDTNESRNSIDSLSNRDPLMQLSYRLKIDKNIPFHSIIGNNTPNKDIAKSDDGVVPWTSSHIEGASSELVIPSWHNVQTQPAAIMEIRRILHLHLLNQTENTNDK